MARYGSDFTSGRYTRIGQGESEMGYDGGYRGDDRWGNDPWGRAERWDTFGGNDGWGTRNRGYGRDLNESWGSMGHGGGRQDYGDQGSGRSSGFRPSPGAGMFGSNLGHPGYRVDQSPGYTDFRGTNRNFYDREMHRGGGRMGHDYDQDFGDRLRRGWNRFRNEARGWMGGGYDGRW